MMNHVQAAKASLFRQLHHGPPILALPNVWDVASARVVEQAGARAIATSSAGIAFALGYPDGEKIPCEEMLDMIDRIARAVELPVTADFEAGYGHTPEDVARNVKAAVFAGAVGINLEDLRQDRAKELTEISLQVEKIQAIREAVRPTGIPIVINARTDIFLESIGEPSGRLDHAIRRANRYREAGADCLFIPGVIDTPTIAQLARKIQGPVNILAGPGCPSIPELQKLGVARVSIGSKASCASLGLVQKVARELLEEGTYESLESPINYHFMNQTMAKRSRSLL